MFKVGTRSHTERDGKAVEDLGQKENKKKNHPQLTSPTAARRCSFAHICGYHKEELLARYAAHDAEVSPIPRHLLPPLPPPPLPWLRQRRMEL